MLAIQADERGPPAQANTAVHDETGTFESPGQDKNNSTHKEDTKEQ